ncbi:MAG: hypothetical protein PHX60_06810 [Giesbergeria sp.]|uniref:hypothetical protein n=1 Tax=Giesbergeria sp. TaxID=2818473 RepID=UPI002620BA66|nr:hypothetical protein [Giesbergeria sp.]MDD2609395.1 hypothetical protein [Giesbergeria sp.]
MGAGANPAVNADGFAAGYFGSLAPPHGGAYSTPVKNPVFVVASFPKQVLPLVVWLNFSGVLLALVQARFSGYAAGFGWLLCGLWF